MATTIPCADCSDEAEKGDRDKYRRHGSALGSLQRWLARNGKTVVAGVVCLVLSVFLLPPLRLVAMQLSPAATSTAMQLSPAATSKAMQLSPAATSTAPAPEIPPCPAAPWKAEEDLRGKCPGDLKPRAGAASASVAQCAESCCADPACVSWQFRRDTGCLQGGDVRLGQEKDGVSAWCSDHPPQRWRGQYVRPKGVKDAAVAREARTAACDRRTWDPDAEVGQCFGLGDEKRQARGSAEECMVACCADDKCGAWQWNRELGCFYSKSMHGCQGDGDPMAFEPFTGRRKHVASRKYIDKHNKPWKMTLT